ncbi:hypothetical protein AJ88_19985 [Mesorhizobium amorphae CCBAU 01583]|nr:hypothetical protein AJ88_19985 [Mesorhizobium amorphae CCBAU 01583]
MRGEPAPRSPAEAAAAAAMAALGSDTIADKKDMTGRKKSMFGGLARAFRGKKDTDMPPLAGSAPDADVPSVDLDEPLDPKLANRPLEPGSGAPDLNAIMKRVRDERGQPVKRSEGDAAKSDFIAAARRAAQAAAAEADALKRQSTMSGPVKALRIGDLLKARRKPILMAAAAIMLALAGLQLGKAFFSDPAPVASNDIAPIIAPQPVETASVNAASEPKAEAMAQDAPARAVRQAEPSAPTVKDDMLAQPASAPPSGADMPMDAVSEPAPAPMESAAPSDATEPTAAASALRPRNRRMRTASQWLPRRSHRPRPRTPRVPFLPPNRHGSSRGQDRHSGRCRPAGAARCGRQRRRQGAVRGRLALCRVARRQGRHGGSRQMVREIG